ncbi:Pyridine nucleotide-disulfide oxidoreductase, FAD/NAD(P)-binding domain containing protein [Desulfovibrio sp. X2]|uniref:dihydrolipoyl dehydrogenase family protein n=1 Tax=Desulfovibrio sp. X2 TaxID=941449 RepID=UPI000358DB70|nr:FAD-dependent oxidoreductase [Desulfovibrio sp. X2]EPR44258.1 Pyridine nucleotide-disulfide oxidoreductase, FAD/NAD(P)-binding domain containing protein [Desulfovibrio sp. X2]
MEHDLIVIGGGPAGYNAALRAAAGGLDVCLVEKAELGGTCLNRGCIPTKFLLAGTAPVEELADQARMKAASGEIAIDLAALQARKDRLLAATRKAMGQRLAAAGVTLRQGLARFDGPNAVELTAEDAVHVLPFRHCLLAAGSVSTLVPSMRPDGQAVLDSDQLLDLTTPPASLIIVGGGVIGIEMGRIFDRLGAQITVVEALNQLVPWEDPEVSDELARVCKRRKWTVKLGARVASLRTENGAAHLALESGETLSAEKALVCIGRRPAVEPLVPAKAGISLTPRGFVAVDEHLRATDSIYAVGDVNGRAMLAHAAEHQAAHAVDHFLGKAPAPYADTGLPSCIYGAPEIMRTGRMAHELLAQGRSPQISRFPMAANPLAQAHASTTGFVKIVWDEGRIAGATAIGHAASHLVSLAEVMVRQGWTREQVEEFVFPHPSVDEALKEACLAAPEPVEMKTKK